MQLSQKGKIFSESVFAFSKFRFNFEHFSKKNMTLIGDVILKLWTPKNVVRYLWSTIYGRHLSKKSRFRGSFEK